MADRISVPVTASARSRWPVRPRKKLAGPPLPDPRRARQMMRAALASVAVSCALVLAKAGAYWLTGSIALMGALVDSASDLFTSLGNFVAIRTALRPADKEHRFGHGKAEPLAGLGQAAFIVGSASFLAFQSVKTLFAPPVLRYESVGIAVLGFSILVTIILVIYQRRVVRGTGSVAVAADNIHYLGDLLTNFAALAALFLVVRLGWQLADPLIGLGIAVALAFSAWHVFLQSYDQLMDHELPDADRDRIKSVVLRHESVRGLHDLRTRAAGTLTFIQIHIEMDPALRLSDAHAASDAIEADLCAEFPDAEIIIHLDPHGLETPPPEPSS